MRNQHRFLVLQFMTAIIMNSSPGHAQKAKEISLSAYPGFTIVNFEKALGYSDDYMEDWNEFYTCAAIRGFLKPGKQFDIGVEIAWQQLYYAFYRVPYGTSPVYREFNISTISLSALGRFNKNNFFAVIGGGLHIFNDGIAPAICLEPGFMLRAGPKLMLPISLKINPIFGDGTPLPVSLGIGAAYTID